MRTRTPGPLCKKCVDLLLMLLSHLLLHVGGVLRSGWSHAHKLGLTQELDPGGLHPESHATLWDRNNRRQDMAM